MPHPVVDFNDLRASNIQYVLQLADTKPNIIPTLFGKLVESDQKEEFLQSYCGAINEYFSTSLEDNPFGPRKLGFDEFGTICYQGGIVKTMITVAQNTRPDSRCAIAGYNAMDSLLYLVKTGTIPERLMCLDQLLENNIVQICLDKLHHPLCIHRQLAVHTLRTLSAEGFLGDKLSSAQTSEIIMNMCKFTLAGPEYFVTQMASPVTTWQSQMIMGQIGIPPSRSARYIPRYYAMAQESAMWAIHGLLCRSPLPTKEFCLEVLRHNPEVIDLLFQCAVISRPAWYPETQVDSIACEVLALLFQFPLDVVPGLFSPFDSEESTLKNDHDAEWNAMVESLKIFTSRATWVHNILSVWAKIEDEKWQDVQLLFSRVKKDYFAITPPDQESFRELFEYRGVSRICMLRLIATITHTVDQCGVTDADICSLLRISYVASHKVKEPTNINPSDMNGLYTWIERSVDIFRTPFHVVFTGAKVDTPAQVPDESIMGPLALIRLLVVVAKRGLLDTIPNWTALPEGTSATSLGHIQQITSANVIRQFLGLALKRLTALNEKGRKCLSENDVEFACFAYTAAAELAMALVAFDNATQHKQTQHIRGVYKELPVYLGNAAEMALRSKQYRRALSLALCAVAAEKIAPSGETIDVRIKAKNARRVKAAKAELKQL